MTIEARTPGSWARVRAFLCEQEPGFAEVEPDGPLALELGGDGWILEVTPEGHLICETGIAMDDVKTLLSEGTCEDLGTDELAKQARALLQRSVSKVRPTLVDAGFHERGEMNEEYVSFAFERMVDLADLDQVAATVKWCKATIT